jgi:hypothetical protein
VYFALHHLGILHYIYRQETLFTRLQLYPKINYLSIAKEVRTVENRRANETAYHITNQEEDELFRLQSCLCDLHKEVHNVFYLLK